MGPTNLPPQPRACGHHPPRLLPDVPREKLRQGFADSGLSVLLSGAARVLEGQLATSPSMPKARLDNMYATSPRTDARARARARNARGLGAGGGAARLVGCAQPGAHTQRTPSGPCAQNQGAEGRTRPTTRPTTRSGRRAEERPTSALRPPRAASPPRHVRAAYGHGRARTPHVRALRRPCRGACALVHVHVHVHVYVPVCMCACACVHVHVRVHLYMCMCICICTYMHMHARTYTCTIMFELEGT